MARTSPVHYIAPSAISITPNANESQRDLAVYVARGTKIKVRCPRAGIGTEAGNYQEWTLTGRNRRLNDTTGTQEYTIYARLSKSDHNTGYLVFAPKTSGGNDKYQYLTLDEEAIYGITSIAGATASNSDWYVRLGDVSAAENGERTVTLDTGILGTDQYNNDWAQNPDDLPLRIELGCTVDDEDVGQNPYVYWDQSLVLTATLIEGWTGTDIQRFDHWEIIRKTDNDPQENRHWLDGDQREAAFNASGEITLSHNRSNDDFKGAVAATFTIMAMEANPDYMVGSGLDPYLVLKSATITILAETIETYELLLSDNIVSYNPQTGDYTPDTDVTVGIRATNQRGDVFSLTKSEVDAQALSVKYAPAGTDSETDVQFPGEADGTAVGTIPIATAFVLQKSINVRLVRTVTFSQAGEGSRGTQTAEVELARTAIAFVRDGEDSKVREWIYRLNSSVGFNATTGTANGKEVSGETDGVDNCLLIDDFVPTGWSDDPTGVSQPGDVEWESWRDYDEQNGRWGAFHAPVIHNRYADDAVTYDIVPSVSVVNARADGTVVSDGIIVRAYRTDGDTRSANILPEMDYPEEGDYYFVEYSIDRGTWQRCEMFFYPTGPADDIEYIPKYGIDHTIVETATDGIAFRLKHSGDADTVLKEVPPITVIRDGAKGYDAVTYDIEFAEAWAKATPEGVISARLRGYAYRIEGSTRTPIASATMRYGYDAANSDTYASTTADGDGYFTEDNWFDGDTLDDFAQGSAVVFVSIIVGGASVCTKHVTIVQEAANGARGHTGRFYYYAEEYDKDKIYRIEPTQAPYVKFTGLDDNDSSQTGFFMLDNGGNEPPYSIWPTDGHPAGPTFKTGVSTPWTQMRSEHQYYIARAFFGENAYLGSFVINGDWMLSQYGTVYDSSGTAHEISGTSTYGGYTKDNAYTLFNPQYPASSQPGVNNFCPNFAVDGLTGNTIQGKGYFRGEVHATSGEFNGIIHASLMYAATKIAGDYTIDPENDPAYMYVGSGELTLPPASQYEGMELKFFIENPQTRSSQMPLVLKPSGTDKININAKYADNFYYIVQTPVSSYTVPNGITVTLRAMPMGPYGYYTWDVVDGDNGGITTKVTIGNKTLHFFQGLLIGVE